MADRYLQDEQERRQNAVDIARLQENVKHLTEGMDRLTKIVERLSDDVEAISKTLTEAKGGWRMLMLMGGAAGSVGTFIGWALSHFKVAP